MPTKLTEKDFLDVKEDLKEGRASPVFVKNALLAFGVFSTFMVGISYAVGISDLGMIGWENLSIFWQTVFLLQACLFSLQIILFFFVKGKRNWTQILMNISLVLYTYKMVLDPFMMVSMFAMDRYVYELFAPIILIIIILGFLLHLYLIRRYFIEIKKEKRKIKNKKNTQSRRGKYLLGCTPVFFLFASLTGYIIKKNMLGEYELFFVIGVATFVFILIMIASVEFVIAAYCVIRYPSFRVNPPKSRKNVK